MSKAIPRRGQPFPDPNRTISENLRIRQPGEGLMRLRYVTGPLFSGTPEDAPHTPGFAMVIHERDEPKAPKAPVYAVIGPFDNFSGQPELQKMLATLLRGWSIIDTGDE